jgi:Sec7-like guanine-nucleotide exchange factor
MLQTDLHNPVNLNKMKKEDYLRQLKYIEEMIEEGKTVYGSAL